MSAADFDFLDASFAVLLGSAAPPGSFKLVMKDKDMVGFNLVPGLAYETNK